MEISQKAIEKKYSRLIGKKIKAMKDNTMTELWIELDKLKEQMDKEFEQKGIKIET